LKSINAEIRNLEPIPKRSQKAREKRITKTDITGVRRSGVIQSVALEMVRGKGRKYIQRFRPRECPNSLSSSTTKEEIRLETVGD
jgi:hypothetical protein